MSNSKYIVDDIVRSNIFSSGEKVAVALSGGADSVALLFILLKVSEIIDLEIIALHVNHSLRENSKYEQEYVKSILDDLCVKGYFFTIDSSKYNENGTSIEESARILRYEFFDKMIDDLGCVVALGHHLEDQSETVLFNILRGSGLKGISGMSVRSRNYVRPLLKYRKIDLLDYLDNKGIKYVTDESNFDIKFTRNKIREKIIPFINKQLDVDANEKLFAMSSIVGDDNDFLQSVADEKYNTIAIKRDGKVILDSALFDELHISVKRRVARKCIAAIYPSLKDISYKNIEDIIRLTSSENGRINLVNDIVVKKVYDKLEFSFDLHSSDSIETYVINKKDLENSRAEALTLGDFKLRLLYSDEDVDLRSNGNVKYFDYDKFGEYIDIRARLPKDFITFKGGKKSIKKFFIDEKIRKDLRDLTYLVVSNGSVAWIVGSRIGEHYKVTDNTKKIIECKYIGEDNG